MPFSIFMLWFYLHYNVFLRSHITYDCHHSIVCLRGSISSSEGLLTAFAPQCLVCSWAQQCLCWPISVFMWEDESVCEGGFSRKVVNKGIVLIWRKYGACSLCRCSLGSRQIAVFSPHISVLFVVIFVVLCLSQRVCRQEVQWVEVC